MTIDDLVKTVLDNLNRNYNEQIWKDRGTKVVEASIIRLFQKFQFDLFRETKFFETTDLDKNILAGIYFSSFETVWKVPADATEKDFNLFKPVLIIDSTTLRIDKSQIAYYEVPPNSVIKYNLNFIGEPKTKYVIDGYLNYTSAKELSSFESIFLEQTADFILYDSLLRLGILLNNSAEALSYAKTMRDEAYSDIINWNNSFSLKGAIILNG